MSLGQKTAWDPELYEARHAFVWQLGEDLISLLDPKPGERILDLGCGPGQLTDKIREYGAEVIGLDSSPDMIGQARQNFPATKFILGNAAEMRFENEFDAIFSNAALHWMLDAPTVAAGMFRALRDEGRLVAEFGGRGNIRQIDSALAGVGTRYYADAQLPPARNFFPSVSEYAGILESNGFEVRFARLFDRSTQLEGADGMKNWLLQFRGYYFASMPEHRRRTALAEVVEELRHVSYRDGNWYVDYRRLRVMAVKLSREAL